MKQVEDHVGPSLYGASFFGSHPGKRHRGGGISSSSEAWGSPNGWVEEQDRMLRAGEEHASVWRKASKPSTVLASEGGGGGGGGGGDGDGDDDNKKRNRAFEVTAVANDDFIDDLDIDPDDIVIEAPDPEDWPWVPWDADDAPPLTAAQRDEVLRRKWAERRSNSERPQRERACYPPIVKAYKVHADGTVRELSAPSAYPPPYDRLFKQPGGGTDDGTASSDDDATDGGRPDRSGLRHRSSSRHGNSKHGSGSKHRRGNGKHRSGSKHSRHWTRDGNYFGCPPAGDQGQGRHQPLADDMRILASIVLMILAAWLLPGLLDTIASAWNMYWYGTPYPPPGHLSWGERQ